MARKYELKSEYCPPIDTCRVIQVIETCTERRGSGVEGDPIRVVTTYWTLDGKFICEIDPCMKKNDRAHSKERG